MVLIMRIIILKFQLAICCKKIKTEIKELQIPIHA